MQLIRLLGHIEEEEAERSKQSRELMYFVVTIFVGIGYDEIQLWSWYDSVCVIADKSEAPSWFLRPIC